MVATDAAGAPGVVLLTMPYSITTAADQAISVQDAGSVLSDANTNYWIIASTICTFEVSDSTQTDAICYNRPGLLIMRILAKGSLDALFLALLLFFAHVLSGFAMYDDSGRCTRG